MAASMCIYKFTGYQWLNIKLPSRWFFLGRPLTAVGNYLATYSKDRPCMKCRKPNTVTLTECRILMYLSKLLLGVQPNQKFRSAGTLGLGTLAPDSHTTTSLSLNNHLVCLPQEVQMKSLIRRPSSQLSLFLSGSYVKPKAKCRPSRVTKCNSMYTATKVAPLLTKPRPILGMYPPNLLNEHHTYTKLSCRHFSTDEPEKKVAMHLMDFPEIIWPSIIKSLRNWILANLIITPYFDKDFKLADFARGSKQAVEVVSDCLSKSEFEKVEDLVAPEVIQEVKRNISLFSIQRREELRIHQEDIYFSFPYQIGVMFNDDDQNQKRFVEITMCYHVLQGLDNMKKQGISPPINMGLMPEYRDKIHICNYRFVREFTKGVDGEWTINVINHFKPSDYVT